MIFPESTVQTRYDSPLGPILLAAAGAELLGLWFDGQRHQPNSSGWPVATDHPVLQQAQAQLAEYFAGQRRAFDRAADRGVKGAGREGRALLRAARARHRQAGDPRAR